MARGGGGQWCHGSPGPLEGADLPCMLTRRHIDALVGQHHQAQRNIEGHHRAGDGVGLVHHEDTCCAVVGHDPSLLDLLSVWKQTKKDTLNSTIPVTLTNPLRHVPCYK